MRFLNVTHMKRKVAQEMVRTKCKTALVTLMHNESSCLESCSSTVCGPREVVPKTKTTTFEKLVKKWKHGAMGIHSTTRSTARQTQRSPPTKRQRIRWASGSPGMVAAVTDSWNKNPASEPPTLDGPS